MTLLLAAKHYCYFHLDIGGRSRSTKCRGQCLERRGEERRGEFALLSKMISRGWGILSCLENDVGSFVEVFRRGWEAKSNFWCIIINERKSALLNVLIHGSGSAYRFTRFANSGLVGSWKIVIRAFDVDDIEHPSTPAKGIECIYLNSGSRDRCCCSSLDAVDDRQTSGYLPRELMFMDPRVKGEKNSFLREIFIAQFLSLSLSLSVSSYAWFKF